ncbi:unnamed protein product [Rotaria socialis]
MIDHNDHGDHNGHEKDILIEKKRKRQRTCVLNTEHLKTKILANGRCPNFFSRFIYLNILASGSFVLTKLI